MKQGNRRIRFVIYLIYCMIFTAICVLAICNEFRVFIRRNPGQFIAILLISFAAVLVVFLLSAKGSKFSDKAAIAILIAGIALRLAYYFVICPESYSDFLQPFLFVEHLKDIDGYKNFSVLKGSLDNYQVYYASFPAWNIYMQIIRFLSLFRGNTIRIAVMINMLLYLATGYLIWKTIIESELGGKIALASLALFSFIPQMVCWASMTTPDHYTVLFIALFLYLWNKVENNRENKRMKFIYIACMAATAGIINLFKPLLCLFFLIFICAEILIALYHLTKEEFKYFAMEAFVFLAVFVFADTSLQKINEITIERTIKTEVVQATGYYLFWGYGIDENNNWSDHGGDELINEIMEENSTLKEAYAEIETQALQMIKTNYKLFLKIWKQKFELLFYSDNWSLLWALRENGQDTWGKSFIILNYRVIERIMAALNIITILLMPFALCRKRFLVIACSMGWLGYILYLIAATIQTRYRYIALIFQFILAAAGCENIYAVGRSIRNSVAEMVYVKRIPMKL